MTQDHLNPIMTIEDLELELKKLETEILGIQMLVMELERFDEVHDRIPGLIRTALGALRDVQDELVDP